MAITKASLRRPPSSKNAYILITLCWFARDKHDTTRGSVTNIIAQPLRYIFWAHALAIAAFFFSEKRPPWVHRTASVWYETHKSGDSPPFLSFVNCVMKVPALLLTFKNYSNKHAYDKPILDRWGAAASSQCRKSNSCQQPLFRCVFKCQLKNRIRQQQSSSIAYQHGS